VDSVVLNGAALFLLYYLSCVQKCAIQCCFCYWLPCFSLSGRSRWL